MSEQGFSSEPYANGGQMGAVQADMLFGAPAESGEAQIAEVTSSGPQGMVNPSVQSNAEMQAFQPSNAWAGGGEVGEERQVGLPTGAFATQVYTQSQEAPAVQPVVQPLQYEQLTQMSQPVQLGGQPVEQPVGQIGAQQAAQPVGQPAVQPGGQPVEQLVSQPIGQPVEKLVSQPIGQPVEQPVSQPVVQQAAQPVGQPVVQQFAQTVGQPFVQQADQPISQPVAQAVNLEAPAFSQSQAFDQSVFQSFAMPLEQGAQTMDALTQQGQPSEGAFGAESTNSAVFNPQNPTDTRAESPLDIVDDNSDDSDEADEVDESSKYAYMQNRELSWLTFNERVLDQGADESVPLLERLNFISIFWSNLQEFFMVRVGSLTDLSFIDPPVADSKTGMTPKEQIRAIHERCRELYPIQESYYEHVRGSLAKQGVRHLRPDDLSEEQVNYLSGFVTYNVNPFLSPQIINPTHPFPHLENGKLYILVRLDDEVDEDERKKKGKKAKKAKKEKGGAEGVVLGLIPLPHQCERIIKLPGRGFQFILLEHAIEMFAAETFSMYKIKHTNVICVTRNADIDANQTGDEQDEDYREHMRRLLKQRARLAPVRLECERPLSPVMEKHMLKKLGLKRYQVYDTIVPLDLSFTWGLGGYLTEKKREKLSNPPFTPAWPVAFDKKRRIIDQVGEGEVLLSYPYESMDPFVQLLKEAAFDPTVVSIKITLYRLASQSQLAEALITAAENGKNVTALFELRARFDESNNIEWSQRFEEAGCNVIYGFHDYKVHSKICCITRQTPQGLQHITQLGTGNYNEKTAKLYTDLSFITTSEAFARDAVEFFRNMQLENVSDNYEILRVAPLQIKSMILDNLDNQIALARQGKPCGAFLKANSITDKDVIEKIAEASQAGVSVTLFIRGICCIVPEVKGWTDNVRVVSIVGRLLEHSRIYCFGTPDDCVMYLSSADLMTRNLNKRVEIAWPILSEEIRWRILDYIDVCLRDTAKLRELRPNKTYTPLGAFCEIDEEGNAQPAFDSQASMIARAAEKAKLVEEQAKEEPESNELISYESIIEEPFAPKLPEDALNLDATFAQTLQQPIAVDQLVPAMQPAVAMPQPIDESAMPVMPTDIAPQPMAASAMPTMQPAEAVAQPMSASAMPVMPTDIAPQPMATSAMPVMQPAEAVAQPMDTTAMPQMPSTDYAELRIEDILGPATTPESGSDTASADMGIAVPDAQQMPHIGAGGAGVQVNAAPVAGQEVTSATMPASEDLTSMSIGDLLEPAVTSMQVEALQENRVQTPQQFGQMQTPDILGQTAADYQMQAAQMPYVQPNVMPQNPAGQPIGQGVSFEQQFQQPAQQGAMQPPQQAPGNVTAQSGQADFFDEGNRPLEMPPKKKGLFKRFRK